MAGGARVLLVGAAPALGGPHRERDGAAGAAERSAGSELLGPSRGSGSLRPLPDKYLTPGPGRA